MVDKDVDPTERPPCPRVTRGVNSTTDAASTGYMLFRWCYDDATIRDVEET